MVSPPPGLCSVCHGPPLDATNPRADPALGGDGLAWQTVLGRPVLAHALCAEWVGAPRRPTRPRRAGGAVPRAAVVSSLVVVVFVTAVSPLHGLLLAAVAWLLWLPLGPFETRTAAGAAGGTTRR